MVSQKGVNPAISTSVLNLYNSARLNGPLKKTVKPLGLQLIVKLQKDYLPFLTIMEK